MDKAIIMSEIEQRAVRLALISNEADLRIVSRHSNDANFRAECLRDLQVVQSLLARLYTL